ncbi:MAG: hypothetical protein R2867_46010 [Caldilineaceae bacterium]
MPNTVPTAEELHRLCSLLQTPVPSNVTLAHFEQWKPLAESLARSHATVAVEVARLLVDIATQVDDPHCLPFALWSVANLYYRLGDYAETDRCFQRARRTSIKHSTQRPILHV